MIGLLGYNFFGDGNSLDPAPTNNANIVSSELRGGIIDNFTISLDAYDISDDIPTKWLSGFIINAGFNGNLKGGSIQDIAGHITGYKIKRRRVGEFDWVTIAEEQVTNPYELTVTITDHLAACLTEYEYAFVPMVGDKEGPYEVKTIMSKFNGIFFADTDNIFKIDTGVTYGVTQTNQKNGIYEPFGRKYPIVVSNGNQSYRSGSLKGVVLNENYDPSVPLDRKAILAQRKLIIEFLNNRRPKIIKDWNGMCILAMVTTNPSIEYAYGSGGAIGSVSVGWTEIGDCEDKQDLYTAGMVPTAD